ncbi:MAG TPA: MMPL family transporter [Chloroflexi bacterium]|nr:MMPL family transporter [Chloroflexota bacterium]
MFKSLARFVTRYKVGIVVFWLAVAAAMVLWAPPLSKVGISNESDFLPKDSPSLRAQKVLEREFPKMASGSDTLVVLANPHGLDDADRAYAKALAAWLQRDPDVQQVTTVFNHPEMKPILLSSDGQAMLMQVDLKSQPYSDEANLTVDRIRTHIQQTRPQNLTVHLTGQTPIGRDLMHHILKSVDSTTWATILLVIVVLLLVYRAPIAAGVPLVTIGVAYLTSRGILGYLAKANIMKVSTMMDAFLVVLIFGVGTDYALFLISRYREEVSRRPNQDREEADRETVTRIAPVLTASAATVVIGTLSMMVARFGMTRAQGPAMALAVAMAWLASITLTPALLSLLGPYLFWPFHRKIRDQQSEHRSPFWERVAHAITAKPGLIAVVTTVVLLLPYILLPQMHRSFDILNEIPASADSRQGFELIKAHFNTGEMMPIIVVLDGDHDLRSPQGLERIAAVNQALAQVDGVAKVRSVVHPTGGEQPQLEQALLAPDQLRTLASGLQKGLQADPHALAQAKGDPTAALHTLEAYLDDFGKAFPKAAQQPEYADARQRLKDLRTRLDNLMQGLQVSTQLNLLAQNMDSLKPGAPSANAAEGLQGLEAYLQALAQAYPEVKNAPGYQQALRALATLQQGMAQAEKMQQADAQLAMLAQALDKTAAQLNNPAALQTLFTPQGQQAESPLTVVGGYLVALGKAYPQIQAQPAYADALTRLQAIQVIQQTLQQAQAEGNEASAQQVQQAVASLQTALQGLSQDLSTLAQTFAGQPAPFSYPPLMQLPAAQQQAEALQQATTALKTGIQTLAKRFEGRDARFVPPALPGMDTAAAQQAIAALETDVKALTHDLNALADALPANAYFLPNALVEQQPEAGTLLSTFLSQDDRAAQIQVLVKGDPYGEQALETAGRIRTAAQEAAQAQGLQAHVTGPIMQVYDIRTIVSEDFPKVMAATTVGVLLVFIILLGSLVAPLYLILTVLLSYGSTMGLSVLVFQKLMGAPGVNYSIPVVIFTLLVALGADYNIFLTSRLWEEAEKRGSVREGVLRASAYTGGVITSAGIILAGTFGALMTSSITSLFQIGAAIAMGVLLDTFIVRAVLVPSIAAVLGRWNWWPAKHPIGHGGLFRLLAERVRHKA